MGFNSREWDNAYRLTIDSSKVYEDLTDFPVSIVLSSGTGQTGFDVSGIFDELTVSGSSYTNRKKIAITTESTNTNSDIDFDFVDESDFVQEDSVSGTNFSGGKVLLNNLATGYPTTQSYYLHTSDTNNIPIYNAQTINSCTITNIQPEYTSIKGLISFDSRSTWKKWNGSSWLTHTGGLTSLSTGNTINQIQDGLTNYHINGAGTYIDFAFDLATTYSGSTPEIDQITITYLAVEECYTEIANWDQVNNTASLWTKVPQISSDNDTELRIYYDKDQDDNLMHVGDTSEVLDIDYDVVIDIGSEGYYDTVHVVRPCVIKESDTSYKMWYSGYDGSNYRIIYCTSTNGTVWTNFQMVINIGSAGSYDAVHASYQSVIKESDTSYKMWYSGYNGTNYRIIYCTSTNGITWTNHQMVVNIGSCSTYDATYARLPCVIKESDTSYKMWYTGFDGSKQRIIYCTSTNGTAWTSFQMVVNVGSEGTYDTTQVGWHSAIKESDISYKMWYSGYDSSNYRIIYCTSTNGITWTNFQMVVNVGSEGTYDTINTYAPVVVKDYDNNYQMWYTGYDGSNYRILYTHSPLPTWDRTVSQEVWSNNFAGVWHMEQDPSGGSNCILDSTLNNDHGTPSGMTSGDLVDGVVGKSLNFDGSNNKVVSSLSGFPSSLSNVTVEFIVKTSSTVSTSLFIAETAQSTNGFNLHFPWGDGNYYWDFGDTTNGGRLSAAWSSAWDNVSACWAFIAENGVGMRSVRDGVTHTTVGTSSTFTKGSKYLSIGYYLGTGLYWPGILDEVRFSTVARQESWISASYDSSWNTLITFSPAGTISGTTFYFDGFVKELNTPVQRTLYLYRRDTGESIGSTTSSGDGGYYIETEYTGNHFVVCVDDEDGIQYEDLIISRALPHSKGWTHDL